MRAQDLARLALLAAIWGASFIFMRTLAPVLGPVATAFSRVAIAGIALVLYFRASGFDAGLRSHWRAFAVIGVVNSAVPFLLYSFAALHLPASYSAIFNAASPLFAALLSALWLGEALTLGRVAGVLAGIAGVALVTRAGPVEPGPMFGWSVAACLGAALCYALSGIYAKRRAAQAKPMAIAGWSQVFAAGALLPILPFAPPAAAMTPAVIGSVLALALLCSAFAYVLYYRLLADVGPTRALTVTFLNPLFAMIWGALFLGEAITWPMLAGCALIVGGAAFVVRPENRGQSPITDGKGTGT